MALRSPLINVMADAAKKAARGLIRDFGEVEQLQVSVKGPANFVSAADHRAEETVFRELSKARPGYGFLMEERGAVAHAGRGAYARYHPLRIPLAGERHHQLHGWRGRHHCIPCRQCHV